MVIKAELQLCGSNIENMGEKCKSLSSSRSLELMKKWLNVVVEVEVKMLK